MVKNGTMLKQPAENTELLPIAVKGESKNL